MKSRSGLIRGCAVPLRAGIRAGIFRYLPVFLAVGLLCGPPASGEPSGNRVVRGVVADGACAIYGMSAEQSQLIALQKARSAAIEQAAGVRVASSTLVRDGMVAVDLIRTYSRGYVIAEKVEWLPIAQYRDSPDRPPIPEYRVRIRADVAIPGRNAPSLGLEAKLNNKVFRRGEKAVVEVSAQRETRLALFNITADDKVVMLFPHPFEKGNVLAAGKTLRFPPEGSRIALEMHTLPGHQRDAEAFLVVATATETEVDFASAFESGKSYPLSSFFERYAEIAPQADEIILPYAIDGSE